MPDPSTTMTPGGWLQLLEGKLDEQCEAIETYQQYFDGEHKLAFATAKFREAFSRFFPPLANNWMKLVVSAPVSRLHIQGFRFDPDPTAPSWELDADRDAWSIWQANNMDSRSLMVHTEAVKCGAAYVMVSPPKNPNGLGRDAQPRITPECADQCFVYSDPADPQTRLAGLKRWVSEIDGYAYATLYLPDNLYKWRSAEKFNPQSQKRIQWTALQIADNPIGVVPLIGLENRQDLKYGGRSDLEEAIPIQDAVNKFCLDMQVSSEFHAFPQRYATGWERGTDAAGRELSGRETELAAGQTRFWRAESPDTKFGQLAPGDVNNYIQPIELYIDHLAAVTQTPAYYLKGKMANLSADALHAADAGLVDRCNAKILGFSDGWEEVMRTAFLAKGDRERGNAMTAETIWGDPETKTIGQLVDAAVKMRQVLSVPLEMCWELMGWSPEKIRQAKNMMNLPNTPADARPTAPNAVLGPDGLPIRLPGGQVSPGIPDVLPAPQPPPQGFGQLAPIPRSA